MFYLALLVLDIELILTMFKLFNFELVLINCGDDVLEILFLLLELKLQQGYPVLIMLLEVNYVMISLSTEVDSDVFVEMRLSH